MPAAIVTPLLLSCHLQRQIWEVQLEDLKAETTKLKGVIATQRSEVTQCNESVMEAKEQLASTSAALAEREADVVRKQDLLEKSRNAEATLKFTVNTMTAQHEEVMAAEEQTQEELQQKIASYKSREQKVQSQMKKAMADNENNQERLLKRHEDDLLKLKSEGEARVKREKARAKQNVEKIAALEKQLKLSGGGASIPRKAVDTKATVEAEGASAEDGNDAVESVTVSPSEDAAIEDEDNVEATPIVSDIEGEDEGDVDSVVASEHEYIAVEDEDNVSESPVVSEREDVVVEEDHVTSEDTLSDFPRDISEDTLDDNPAIEKDPEVIAFDVEEDISGDESTMPADDLETGDVEEVVFVVEDDDAGDESIALPEQPVVLEVKPDSVEDKATIGPPKTTTPKATPPRAVTPNATTPTANPPRAVTPKATTPKATTPKTTTPNTTTPKATTPKAITPKMKVKADKLKSPTKSQRERAPSNTGNDTIDNGKYMQLKKEYADLVLECEDLKSGFAEAGSEREAADSKYKIALREIDDYKRIKDRQAAEIQDYLVKVNALNVQLDGIEDTKASLRQEIFTLKRRVDNAKEGGKIDEVLDKLDAETVVRLELERKLEIKVKEVETYHEQCLQTGKELFHLCYFNAAGDELQKDFEDRRERDCIEQFEKNFRDCAVSSIESILTDLRSRAKPSEDLLKSKIHKFEKNIADAQNQIESLQQTHSEEKVMFTGETDDKLKEAIKVQVSLRLMVREKDTKLARAVAEAEKVKDHHSRKSRELERKVKNLEKQKTQLFDEGKEARFLLNNATRDLLLITEERGELRAKNAALTNEVGALTVEENRLTEWIGTLEESKRQLKKLLNSSEAEVAALLKQDKDRRERRVTASTQTEQKVCDQEVQTNFVSPQVSLRQANSSFRFPAALSFNQPPGVFLSSGAKVQRSLISLPSLSHSASMDAVPPVMSPSPIVDAMSRSVGEVGSMNNATSPMQATVHLKIPRVEMMAATSE
jgi:hypothetical protein